MGQKYIVIDPTSTEFNRGSFCYLPYILYCSLRQKELDVELWEDFTAASIDDVVCDDAIYYVSLWSYPQIDLCQVLDRQITGWYDGSFF